MTAELVKYDHHGRITQARVDSQRGEVALALGHDTARGWAALAVRIGPNDARHIAALLTQAAEDADA